MNPVEIAELLDIRTTRLEIFNEWCFWIKRIEDVKAFHELCEPQHRRWLETEQHYGLEWTVKWVDKQQTG